MGKSKPVVEANPEGHERHSPRAGRRAFFCDHRTKGEPDCSTRVFVIGDEHPICREHGETAMRRQANAPYMGQPIPEAA